MHRILTLLLLVTVIAGAQLGPATSAVAATGTATIVVEWAAPPYHLASVVGTDGRTYTHVEVQSDAYNNGGLPGFPSLPSLGRLVALPPSGDFGLELLEVEVERVPLDYPIEPALSPDPLQLDASGEPLPGEWVTNPDAVAYSSATPFPGAPVTLGPPVWMRDHRLARLTFNPFRYRPAQGTLEVVRHVRFRVWWQPPVTTASPPTARADDPFQAVLSRLLLNPADLDPFRAPDPPTAADLQPAHSTDRLAGQTYKVLVAAEGLYALDYATLAAAGLPLGNVDPATLRLTHAGVEVAAQWQGDADAAFEAGERLLFYARPQLTRFAGYDVYWLSWGGAAGLRMASRSGDPSGLAAGTAWATVSAEENAEYDSLNAGRDGDHWFWLKLKLPDLVAATLELSLETPAAVKSGTLTVWLQGFTSADPDPDHRVRFSVNGTDVGAVQWEGAIPYVADLTLPPGLLHAGSNTLAFGLPGDTGSNIEGTWVDAVAVTYGLQVVSGDVARFRGQDSARRYTVAGFSTAPVRIYDVTAPHATRVVTGFSVANGQVTVGDHGGAPAEYLILTDARILSPLALLPAKSLADPASGADYIIVTHPDFQAALAPLVAHRRAQGLRVVVADVEAVYDRFGGGRMDPTAIRSFLAHAYANWPRPAPQYALLVGDATYDPRGYRPDSNPTYLPSYLADVDLKLGETASDNQYADLTGDPLPELRLGRFPVNTPAQVQAIVDKIISYETDPLPGDWNRRLVFGADNPSTAGDHHSDADEQYITYATPGYGYVGARVYLSETAGPSYMYTRAQAATDALIAQLDRGALLYTYFGHASWHQEAVLETDGYAPLFHRDHIAQLNNQRRWPVVLHMTCLTAHFTHLTSETLDESLLRTAGVGAIAVWGPSGSSVAPGHRLLHRSFFQAVFDDGQAELGVATQSALLNLYAAKGQVYEDLIQTYHLFGDPALALDMTFTDLPFSIFLPIILRGG
jgi:hypothetical protein